MDEETRAFLEGMMRQINDQFERVLERLNTVTSDVQNTKTFLIDDALTLGRRVSAIERRLDDLEKR